MPRPAWSNLSLREVLRVVVVLMLMAGGLLGALNLSTTGAFDFPVATDPVALAQTFLQVAPILCAFAALLLARPVDARVTRFASAGRDRLSGWRLTIGLMLATLALASLLFLASWVAMMGYLSMTGQESMPGAANWLWLGYFVDLVAITLFIQFLFALTRRTTVSLALFLGYAIVVVWGARHGINVRLLGFATTSDVIVTRYDALPIGVEAAWQWRVYWLLVAGALLGLLACYDRRFTALLTLRPDPLFARSGNAVLRGALVGVMALAAGVMGYATHHRETEMARRYPSSAENLSEDLLTLSERPSLVNFAVQVTARRSRHIDVTGQLAVENRSTQPMPAILLEKAQLLQLTVATGGRIEHVSEGQGRRAVILRLSQPLLPHEKLQIRYAGQLDSQDAFDLPSRAVILSSAFFLNSGSILPLPRRASCFLRPVGSDCESGENYQLADAAQGRVEVDVPRDLSVAGARRIASASERAHYILDVAPGALANVLVAAAPFTTTEFAPNAAATRLTVYSAPTDSGQHKDVSIIGQHVLRQINTFGKLWGAVELNQFSLIETPPTLAEAAAYRGSAAIGEQFFRLLRTDGRPSEVLNMVLSHEIAHQWWGYALVPAKSPGWPFLLESIPQFAALDQLSRQKLAAPATLRKTGAQRVEQEQANAGTKETRLLELEAPDWQAYHAGALALLRMDDLSQGRLAQELGIVWREAMQRGDQLATSEHIVQGLLARLPADKRDQALQLMGMDPQPAQVTWNLQQ